jgi:NAD(P)-dependent dehydrogenase (short-subunit alcohol dehydrogenase family)
MSNQRAVIVGGSSGIGLATARHLCGLNFEITITGRSETKLNEAGKSLGDRVTCLAVDATDADAMKQAFLGIGTFDHLILALGSHRGLGPFTSVSLADFCAGFEEKVFPHFACARAAVPHLRDGGSMVFVSAVSAQAAMPGAAGIGAANAAIAALVPTLAVELRPLRVNCVSPGVIDTPWWDFLPSDQRAPAFANFASRTPVGRVGRPEDVAQAIAFLVSDTFISGHTIICDGGARLVG